MKERPILFSAPMVRALLDGSKTQTRRVMKTTPYGNGFKFVGNDYLCHNDYLPPSALLMDVKRGKTSYTVSDVEGDLLLECPHGQPGDRLWVREAFAQNWNQLSETRMDRSYVYRADGGPRAQDNGTDLPWKPSIHMPRIASRITLEITGVRVERLQDISRGDAMDEGCPFPNMAQGPDPRQWYAELWDEINGAGRWAANPFVWVVGFRRV